MKKMGNGKTLQCIVLDPNEACRLFFGRGYENHLTKSELIVLSNEFSKMLGRKPFYKYTESIDLCDVIIGCENDTKNISGVAESDGFRIPSLSDVKTCLSYFSELPPLENTGLFSAVYNYKTIDVDSSSDANILLYCLEDDK